MSHTTNDSTKPLEAEEVLPPDEALQTIQELRQEAEVIGDVHVDDQDEP